MPKVSIITVNYNQAELSLQLLDSINHLEFDNVEVLVVDNGSNKPLTEYEIRQRYANAILIRSEENLGFAGGNNLALRKATGDYLFLVNNDAELTPNVIKRLLQTFAQNPDAGVVCPKICHFDRPDVMQFIGFTQVNPFTGRNLTLGENEKYANNHAEIRKTPYAHGAAMMLKREVLQVAGEMPEEYFLYYEELAWSENIKHKGYRIYVNPQATIYHKESASIGLDSPLKAYYLNRNRILFMRNYVNIGQLMVFALYLMLISIPKNLLVLLLKGKTEHLSAYWAAILWHFNRRENRYERKNAQSSILNQTPKKRQASIASDIQI